MEHVYCCADRFALARPLSSVTAISAEVYRMLLSYVGLGRDFIGGRIAFNIVNAFNVVHEFVRPSF